MKLKAAFKWRCEGIAVDWRHRLHLRAFDRLSAMQLLKALGGEAVPPDQLHHVPQDIVARMLARNDWSAGIVRRDPLLIVYHPAHAPPRFESNMMHELAHVLLDHPMIGFSPETGLPLRDERYEQEAAYLGGCLQIPRLGLQWTVQRGYTYEQIAAHFGASESMVRFRSNVTGISINL